jgi:hypothetical protein
MPMSSPSVLQVVALRSGDKYQAAEALRQKKFNGSKAAKKISLKQGTPEYAALRLLIGTWDAIGHQVLALQPNERIPFYETNPVGYMWKLLEPAVIEIRKHVGNHYARNFQNLAKAYNDWLAQQPQDYQTAASNGLTAQFG